MDQLKEIMTKENILDCKVENKFVIYNEEKNIYYSREKIIYQDGREESKLRLLKDYKRPFWLTKPFYQKYKQGKEFEELSRVNVFYAPQNSLYQECWKRLGKTLTSRDRENPFLLRRPVSKNPYVYGISTHGKVYLRSEYRELFGEISTPYVVTPLDIEWDTVKDQLCLISFVFNNVCYTFINSEYLNKAEEQSLYNMFTNNIPTEGFTPKYSFHNNELECIKACFAELHKLKPDIITVWNIEYDIGQILLILERNEIDPKDIFSHPEIEPEDRYFYWKKDKEFRLSSSGVRKGSEPKDRWHILEASCYSYFLDAMSVYNYVRAGRKRVPTGYSLDSILGFELGYKFKKLKFKHLTEEYVGLEWHRQMVRAHFKEYIIYNQYDVIAMVILDNKTGDVSKTLPLLSDLNTFDLFPRGPASLVNEMTFFGLKNGKIMGKADMDQLKEHETLGLDNWIITLPNANLNPEYGYNLLSDLKTNSNIRRHVFDLDQTSGYPNNIRTANVGKDTTIREVTGMEGKTKLEFMGENINLIFGEVNSISYCTNILNFPTIEELDKFITEKKNNM